MISQLTRYISTQLATALLIIALSLTAIVWLTQALRFIDFIVNRGVSAFTFVKMTGLMIPSLLFVVLPLAVFISVLFVYHRLSQDSELVVLRAAGQSRRQLARPVWLVAGIAMLFSYFVSFYLMPVTYHKFKEMQSFLRDNYASLLLQEEVFNNPVKGLTVFVRKRHNDGTLEGLLVHDNRDPDRPITMMAQRGRLEQTDSGPRFLLYNGSRQEVRSGRFSFLKFDEYAVDLSFYASEAASRHRKPDEYYIHELFSSQQLSKSQRDELLAEAHYRLTWPVLTLIMGLFAYANLLRGEFNRRGQTKRMAAITLAAITIIAFTMGLQNLVNQQVMLAPLLYINLLCWFGFILWQLRDRTFPHIPESAGEQNA